MKTRRQTAFRPDQRRFFEPCGFACWFGEGIE
jgi:hypothetical protein